MPHATRSIPRVSPVCVVFLFVMACEAPRGPAHVVIELPRREPEKPVKISDLGTPPPPSEHRVGAPLAPRRVLIHLMAFERDSPRTPLALDLLDDTPPDTATLRAWRDNRFVFATVERSRVPLLLANLDKPVTGQVATLFNAGVDNPVTLIRGVSNRSTVDVVESDGAITPERFFAGEFRLLVKITPPQTTGDDAAGAFRIDILPQHFTPRRLLKVDPEDRSKEGRSFDQLYLHRELGEDEVWVITTDPRPPVALPLDGGDTPEPRSTPRTISLADAMLTGLHAGRPIRLMILVSLEEHPPTP